MSLVSSISLSNVKVLDENQPGKSVLTYNCILEIKEIYIAVRKNMAQANMSFITLSIETNTPNSETVL